MIEAKNTKKLARHTFLTNDGFEHPKMTHLTLFIRKRQASVFIPFSTLGFASRDR